MKVRELIQTLQRLNPDAEVVFPSNDGYDLETVGHIGYDPWDRSRVVLDDCDWRWQCTYPRPPNWKELQRQELQAITNFALTTLLEYTKFPEQYLHPAMAKDEDK